MKLTTTTESALDGSMYTHASSSVMALLRGYSWFFLLAVIKTDRPPFVCKKRWTWPNRNVIYSDI